MSSTKNDFSFKASRPGNPYILFTTHQTILNKLTGVKFIKREMSEAWANLGNDEKSYFVEESRKRQKKFKQNLKQCREVIETKRNATNEIHEQALNFSKLPIYPNYIESPISPQSQIGFNENYQKIAKNISKTRSPINPSPIMITPISPNSYFGFNEHYLPIGIHPSDISSPKIQSDSSSTLNLNLTS